MTNFTILMYEDELDWKRSFEYSLKDKINLKGKSLVIEFRENGDTLEQDLIMCIPDLIMVDYDLGTTTGEEIIQVIDNTPECKNVSVYFYSGGETLDDLRKRAKEFSCQIRCFTKQGDDLDSAVLALV